MQQAVAQYKLKDSQNFRIIRELTQLQMAFLDNEYHPLLCQKSKDEAKIWVVQ